MTGLLLELRGAIRRIKKQRGVFANATVAVSVGIAASLAVSGVVDHLSAVAAHRPEDVHVVVSSGPYTVGQDQRPEVSIADVALLRSLQRRFVSLGGFNADYLSVVRIEGRSHIMCRTVVTSGAIEAAGLIVAEGRTLREPDFVVGAPPVALITASVARRLAPRELSLVGHALHIDGQSFTVVGTVQDPGFDAFRPVRELLSAPAPPCVITPLSKGNLGEMESLVEYLSTRPTSPWLTVLGRTDARTTSAELNRDLARVSTFLAAEPGARNPNWTLVSIPLASWRSSSVQSTAFLLRLASLVILAIAVGNTTSTFAGLALAQRSELSTRLALGASTALIGRTIVVQALVWCLPGAMAAIPLGLVMSGLVHFLLGASQLPLLYWLRPFTLGSAVLLSVAIGLCSGLLLTLTLRHRIARLLSSRSQSSSILQVRLLVVQLGLVVSLGMVAWVVVSSVLEAYRTDYGFNLDGGLVLELRLPRSRYPTGHDQARFAESISRSLTAADVVDSLAIASAPPLSDATSSVAGDVAIRTPNGVRRIDRLNVQYVTAAYFEALSLKSISGRLFSADEPGSVAVVSHSFAHSFLRDIDPTNAVIAVGPERFKVVGVVSETMQRAPSVYLSPEANPSLVYLPYEAFTTAPSWCFLVVGSRRLRQPSSETARAVIDTISALEPEAAIGVPLTFRDLLRERLSSQSRLAIVLSVQAAMAGTLAGTALFAALSQFIIARARDLAIMTCLGARRFTLVRFLATPVLVAGGLATISGGIAGFLIAAYLAATFPGLKVSLLSLLPAIVALWSSFSVCTILVLYRATRPSRLASR